MDTLKWIVPGSWNRLGNSFLDVRLRSFRSNLRSVLRSTWRSLRSLRSFRSFRGQSSWSVMPVTTVSLISPTVGRPAIQTFNKEYICISCRWMHTHTHTQFHFAEVHKFVLEKAFDQLTLCANKAVTFFESRGRTSLWKKKPGELQAKFCIARSTPSNFGEHFRCLFAKKVIVNLAQMVISCLNFVFSPETIF